MKRSIFKTISPKWEHIPDIKAITILARSDENKLISFAGDSDEALTNRKNLENLIKPPYPIHWLKQVHGNIIVNLPESNLIEADGATTTTPGVVCTVRTADCLPIVFTNLSGAQIGIVHAGWKGLQKKIIEKMIEKFDDVTKIYVWIGPGISQESYEVGAEVRDAFVNQSVVFDTAFNLTKENKYNANLYKIAIIQLKSLGINPKNISGAKWDTFSQTQFHSARRDGLYSGRMATVVWIKNND